MLERKGQGYAGIGENIGASFDRSITRREVLSGKRRSKELVVDVAEGRTVCFRVRRAGRGEIIPLLYFHNVYILICQRYSIKIKHFYEA